MFEIKKRVPVCGVATGDKQKPDLFNFQEESVWIFH